MGEDVPRAGGGQYAAGSRIGGYLLEEQIGQGGMAAVFRALDERLRRPVALKVLAPALAADTGFRQRFMRESRTAAAVDDPHIIPIFEAGEADGVLFIAMRYVRGGDVGSLLREGALDPVQAAELIAPVASALDAAHAAGLVHRDVKPANMLLDVRAGRPDHIYLSDFGLSKEALGPTMLTETGQFLGTVNYAAPEQIEGRPVDGRTDQYALACAAFEMLCGAPPFSRERSLAVLYAHMSEPPPPVGTRRPGLPTALDPVFARALAKEPGERYDSCREFSAALRDALGIAPYDFRPHILRTATEVVGSGAAGMASLAGGSAGWETEPIGEPALVPQLLAPTRPGAGTTGRAGSWRMAAAAVGGAAAVALIAFSVAALNRHGPGSQGSVGGGPTGTSSRTPVSTASRPSSSSSAGTPAQSTTPTGPGGSGVPGGPSGPANIWIAQLASVPVSSGTTRLNAVLAQVRLDIPGAQVLTSADYSSLRPGYWVIYFAGGFSDGAQALAYCASHGRPTSSECIGRYLSHHYADFSYQCYPPATSSTPHCTRP